MPSRQISRAQVGNQDHRQETVDGKTSNRSERTASFVYIQIDPTQFNRNPRDRETSSNEVN